METKAILNSENERQLLKTIYPNNERNRKLNIYERKLLMEKQMNEDMN